LTLRKRQITIRIDAAAVDYFKRMAAEMGMPYQNLINLFLRDCAIQKRRPTLQWPGDTPDRGGRRSRQQS
jgi:antitoxin component of RelBE/YafQ-DinJ toxin-antitoxin module